MTFVYAEFPLGSNNGTNTSFRLLTAAPNPTSSLSIILNGIKQKQILDFTVNGTTVTMVRPPMPNDVFIAYYTY